MYSPYSPAIVGLEKLKELNDCAIEQNYNRAIAENFFSDKRKHQLFMLTPLMTHEHACGERVPMHLRCAVSLADELLCLLDVPLDRYPLQLPADVFDE